MHWQQHPSWHLLKRCIQQEWERMVMTLAVFLALAILGTLFLPGPVRILCLTGGAFAAWYLWHFTFGPGHWRRSDLLRDLTRGGERITWIYAVAYQRIPFGFFFSERYRVFLGFDDGTRHDVLVPATKYRAIMVLLQRVSPHATVGWNETYQATFDKDPASLRRDQGSKAR
jgi:hypothetical protein